MTLLISPILYGKSTQRNIKSVKSLVAGEIYLLSPSLLNRHDGWELKNAGGFDFDFAAIKIYQQDLVLREDRY